MNVPKGLPVKTPKVPMSTTTKTGKAIAPSPHQFQYRSMLFLHRSRENLKKLKEPPASEAPARAG